jgi:hypothetical protein
MIVSRELTRKKGKNMSPNKTTKQWPLTSAIVISDETNLSLIIRTLIKTLDWNLEYTTASPSFAIEQLQNNTAKCLIVIDSPTLPAAETLRNLHKNGTARLTPTIVLAPENLQQDLQIYEKIFRVNFATKPLTPNNFISAFTTMLRTWEKPAMSGLRKLTPLIADDKMKFKLEILRKLRGDLLALPLALQAEVAILVSTGHPTTAELILLDAFKSFPNSLNVIAQLAWFYLNAKMPDQAILYLKKLKSIAAKSTIFNLDLAAAYIAKSELSTAIPYMMDWKNTHVGNEIIDAQIARILVAEGKIGLADALGVPKGIVKKTADIWDQFDHRHDTASKDQETGPRAS